MPPRLKVTLMPAADIVSTGRCGLSLCGLIPCNLGTHHAYVARAVAAKAAKEQAKDSLTRTSSQSSSSRNSSQPASNRQETELSGVEVLLSSYLNKTNAQPLDRQITDGLPSLPFETQHVHVCRDLVHHYTTVQLHRRARVYTPGADPADRIQFTLKSLYAYPIVSICALGNSQAHKLMLGRAETMDQTTQIVYGIVLRELRRRIDSHRPAETPLLLLLVSALVGLEYFLNANGGLKLHREAIQNLVIRGGGIHAIGNATSYVIQIDRFLALCLGERPLYKSLRPPTASTLPIGRRGAAFAEVADTIDPAVCDFLLDQCRLFEMLETSGVDLMNEEASPSQSQFISPQATAQFLSLRDRAGLDLATLHAHYHDNQVDTLDPESVARATSISRCALLGGHIVSYAASHGDYYPTVRLVLGSELEEVLKRKPRSDWQGNEDLIIWLLFGLAMIPRWRKRRPIVTELRGWLSRKHVRSWPDGQWMVEEASRLNDFLWYDLSFKKAYDAICTELLELDTQLRPGNVEV